MSENIPIEKTSQNLYREMGWEIMAAIKKKVKTAAQKAKEAAKKGLLNSKDPHGVIVVRLRTRDGAFEILIQDSAPEFTLDILANIGQRDNTSRHGSGGLGEGFANTLGTLAMYNASLIIHEYAPESESIYTKGVIFRFDGKRDFIIRSYRADMINDVKENSPATVEYAEKEIIAPATKYPGLSRAWDELPQEGAAGKQEKSPFSCVI